jgi:hypothetical protein
MDRISKLERAKKRLSPAEIRTLFADLAEPFVPGLGATRQAMSGNYGQAAISGLLDFGGPIGKAAGLAAAPMMGAIKKADILDYAMTHRPMSLEGGASMLFEPQKSFGEDIFSKNALQYFGSGDPREKSILNIMRMIRGNPEAEVTIYRGVPKGTGKQINTGDWVTLDRNVASDYGPVILEKKVRARDITTWPDSLLEFGYYPGSK